MNYTSSGIVRITNGSTGYGSLQSGVTDAGTATTPVGLQTGHNTSGTPAAGFGVAHLFVGQDSTTADQNVGRIVAKWATATHASRAGDLGLQSDGYAGPFEGFGTSNDGTQALVSFFGAARVARAASPGTASGTDAVVINAIITILRNLGLCT